MSEHVCARAASHVCAHAASHGDLVSEVWRGARTLQQAGIAPRHCARRPSDRSARSANHIRTPNTHVTPTHRLRVGRALQEFVEREEHRELRILLRRVRNNRTALAGLAALAGRRGVLLLLALTTDRGVVIFVRHFGGASTSSEVSSWPPRLAFGATKKSTPRRHHVILRLGLPLRFGLAARSERLLGAASPLCSE